MDPDKFPYLEDKFLRALDEAFPQKQIVPSSLPADIMFNAGQRDVIVRLKHLSRLQRDKK